MVRSTSVLSQILHLVPRELFERLVLETGAEKRTKGFRSWDQFAGMLWLQLAGAKSLREIELGMGCAGGKLNHLGLEKNPARSTLSYANSRRPAELFERLFHQLSVRFRAEIRGAGHRKLRIKNPMLSVDGSVLDYLAEFLRSSDYKRVKGGLKLHLVLDHEGHLPAFASVTDVNASERKFVYSLRLQPGSFLIMDRGYYAYRLFRELDEQGVFFVTRAYARVRWKTVEQRSLPNRDDVLDDRIVVAHKSPSARQVGKQRLRLIRWWDKENDREFEFVTNNFKLAASTIARIYKARWQIESFFKDLKQVCKLKTFVGLSSNAIQIQIWTALIAILLLKYMKLKSRTGWSLSNLVAALRFSLLLHRDLWSWIADPFGSNADPPELQQLQFSF